MTASTDILDGVAARWPRSQEFRAAVRECVARFGYASADVATQLNHVAARCSGEVMRSVIARELPAGVPDDAPQTVLVLATGRVPGLALEGVAAALAVDARVVVRPSRDEAVLHHVLAWAARELHELNDAVEMVGRTSDDIPWARIDGAVVFGSGATINFVRDQLDVNDRHRIAAYGARQGVALVDASVLDDDSAAGWARRLADDVLTFRQHGCMSPSWLYAVGDAQACDVIIDTFGRELIAGRQRHVAPGIDTDVPQRRNMDADVLGAIAAGLTPGATALFAGDARVTVVRCDSNEQACARVAALGTLQQTAVVAAAPGVRARMVEQLAQGTHITRICEPGDAHRPDPLWPQDGIGRVAPLLQDSVRT